MHLFDEIVRTMPDGVYLTAFKQNGKQLKFEGVAQSSTRVSTFMRNIDGSEWLKNPELEVVESKPGNTVGQQLHARRAARSSPPATMTTVRRPRPSVAPGQRSRQMNLLEELRSLDPRDPGRWPLAVRAGAVAVCFVVVSLLALYFFVWTEQRPELQQREDEEQQLRQRVPDQARQGREPRRLQAAAGGHRESFGAMLRQLPGKTEVPTTCWSTSRRPAWPRASRRSCSSRSPRVKKDFYAELPIKIRLTGSYHQFGEFVSGIAALPRIVTLHDIEIKPAEQGRVYDQLSST